MAHELQPTWKPDDVEQLLRDALDLVARVDPPADLRLPAFQVGFQLLSQRLLVPTVSGIAIAERVFGSEQLPQ